MSYMDAPATRLVASHCCVCGLPLVDAKSVELGIGPDCRKKYGFDQACEEEVRKEANALVYIVALDRKAPEALVAIGKIRTLGFVKLADILEKRIAKIRIEVDPGRGFLVVAPYHQGFLSDCHALRGRWAPKPVKAWAFREEQRRDLWDALCHWFDGEVAWTPKGLIRIGKPVPATVETKEVA